MVFPRKKSIIIFAISFILLILMSFLFLADAPAYVRCRHIGMCEFLEIEGISNTYKEIVKSTLINNQRYQHLFAWLKNSIYSYISYRSTSKNLALIAPFFVLKRYINPYPNHKHKNICNLHENPIKILLNIKYIAYKKSPILSAKRIHIITSSIMKS